MREEFRRVDGAIFAVNSLKCSLFLSLPRERIYYDAPYRKKTLLRMSCVRPSAKKVSPMRNPSAMPGTLRALLMREALAYALQQAAVSILFSLGYRAPKWLATAISSDQEIAGEEPVFPPLGVF